MAGLTKPPRREIREPRDAELAARDWMRWIGYTDAVLTQGGADGGIDVQATGAVAQVKAEAAPVGRPAIQRLHGVAQVEEATALFFSWGGYSDGAVTWARRAGVALFTLSMIGEVGAVNRTAVDLVDGLETESEEEKLRREREEREAEAERERQEREAEAERERQEREAEAERERQERNEKARRERQERKEKARREREEQERQAKSLGMVPFWDKDGPVIRGADIWKWIEDARANPQDQERLLAIVHRDTDPPGRTPQQHCWMRFVVEGGADPAVRFTTWGFDNSAVVAAYRRFGVPPGGFPLADPEYAFRTRKAPWNHFHSTRWRDNPYILMEMVRNIAGYAGRNLDGDYWRLDGETRS